MSANSANRPANGPTPTHIVIDEAYLWSDEKWAEISTTLHGIVREWSTALAREREAAARVAVLELLPRPLAWLVDHPRLLRHVYRVRPAWRPTITVRLDCT